jgi:hypothetical protein
LVLDAESRLHSECRALFDGEGLLVQLLKRAGLHQVDDDVLAAGDLEAQREDDDLARV